MKRAWMTVWLLSGTVLVGDTVASSADATAHGRTRDGLTSCRPEAVLSRLDLNRPDLAAVRAPFERGDHRRALKALLDYYRRKHSASRSGKRADADTMKKADQVVNHVFQWGSYPAVSYGEQMDWSRSPYNDAEWVCAMHRFIWVICLGEAYAATHNERYALAFVDLTKDWIGKHPLERADPMDPKSVPEIRLAWKDLQTSLRARWLCWVFPKFVHSNAFTPGFLGVFLASMHDHQIKTELRPRDLIDNMAITESRGLAIVAKTFPEFAESPRWMSLAIERTENNLAQQLTPDGVQRERAPGYHWVVTSAAADILQDAEQSGFAVPANYQNLVRKMYDHLLGIATPDLCLPMFGDTRRHVPETADRRKWPLYSTLIRATELLRDPRYAAVAQLNQRSLPLQTSYAFPEGGIYAMRSGWGPDDIYLALHCSPPTTKGHDQPDNGTFELYAFGRWLMTDSGFYVYGGNPQAHEWHRQTAVHQTLTLNRRNAAIDGKHLLWQSEPRFGALVVENRSYEKLVHRRSVWFVHKEFFVFLDEAIGDGRGVPRLHFQLAVGDIEVNTRDRIVRTTFPDANVVIWSDPRISVTVEEEAGWYAWDYGKRLPRRAFCFRQDKAPTAYLTLVVPFRGVNPPRLATAWTKPFSVGDSRVAFRVRHNGTTYRVGRDLGTRTAWCEEEK